MRSLISKPRGIIYRTILQAWLLVAAYAVAHDQYLVRIEPRHFTEYHPSIPGIDSPLLQAAIIAFSASFAPGLALGIACTLAAWAGTWPQLSRRYIFTGVSVVIALSEIASQLSRVWVMKRGSSFYPDIVFPERSLPILITQTVQITCYLASATLSFSLLLLMLYTRYLLRQKAEPRMLGVARAYRE